MAQHSNLSLKKKLLTGGLACVLAVGSISALADKDKDRERGGWGEHHERMSEGPMGHHGMGDGGFPMRGIDLDRKQRKQMEAIMDKHQDSNRDHRRTMRDMHDDYMQALLDNASDTELNSLISKRSDLMQKQMLQQSQVMREMLELLTPEQKEQLKKRYK
ncbi:LTXXQ motif family protein [Oceanospirillum multiglobuliferum]|uniref:Zinc resistance-associated protein n=1 Tax=Oceanospirillum multiglobuliferum TaxID=64969 RepID=A0A1T4SF50_9GAMM|nr:Spy/CpxP family protein refolding chaperone [Oceanospirillum multiglobuliferum]OPX54290.1 hypothetical protein BTE48_14955 [Oceanospirillum multiglobuliferum]SKA26783.1 LTXXQ motif family protein [Oceanospirillum multiglobuliferum]